MSTCYCHYYCYHCCTTTGITAATAAHKSVHVWPVARASLLRQVLPSQPKKNRQLTCSTSTMAQRRASSCKGALSVPPAPSKAALVSSCSLFSAASSSASLPPPVSLQLASSLSALLSALSSVVVGASPSCSSSSSSCSPEFSAMVASPCDDV
jgi:hypothetical protein